MDEWGIDAEDYIAAVRAGALDPDGMSADELQVSLDAYDAELTARIIAMSEEDVERGAPIPPLPVAVESEGRRGCGCGSMVSSRRGCGRWSRARRGWRGSGAR